MGKGIKSCIKVCGRCGKSVNQAYHRFDIDDKPVYYLAECPTCKKVVCFDCIGGDKDYLYRFKYWGKKSGYLFLKDGFKRDCKDCVKSL